jgi:hypothetical protein
MIVDDLPPARRGYDPGGSGYRGVWIRRIRHPKKVYWYFAVPIGSNRQYRYFPYTVEGLQQALQMVRSRGHLF